MITGQTAAIVQRGIDQPAAKAAMRLAVLQIQLADAKAMAKAAGEAVKARREDMAQWAELDGARTQFAADTKETRQEIAALAKAYREAIAKTDEGRTMERERERIRSLTAKLAECSLESRQMLMPFAEGIA